MAELADAYGSGPYGSNSMRVQVSFPAGTKSASRNRSAFSVRMRNSADKPYRQRGLQHMVLYFIRHGETSWNVEGKMQGQTDIPLNENGIRKEYIDNVRQNLRNQLNNINIQDEDGSIENLGERYGSKNAQ